MVFEINKIKGKTLLLCHENSDLDTFCSAAIMQLLLKKKKVDADIAIPSHINEQTLEFASQNKISFKMNPALEEYENIFLFDFNDYEQLGQLRKSFESLEKSCLNISSFDHHVIEKRSIAKKGIIDSKYFSTTQLLYENFKKRFDKKMCFLACLGMFEDTGRFIVGSMELFASFSECLKKSEKKYSELFGIANHKIPRDEQKAFLNAAQRARMISIGEIQVIFSHLSFYQGAAATKLLDFGADIAIVAGKNNNEPTILSARAETSFKEQNNFNLMKDLMVPLQKKVGGEIGGHSGAAQWKGEVGEKVIMDALIILENKFKKK